MLSYICYKSTTTVLATAGTVDFVYTCTTHLTDPGFATPVPVPVAPTPVKPKLTEAEIKKVADEWKEKQRLKAEKAKSKEANTTAEGGTTTDSTSTSTPPAPPTPVTPPAPPAPSHPQFILHRQIFAMRQAEHRKKRQATRVKQVAPQLPSVPQS